MHIRMRRQKIANHIVQNDVRNRDQFVLLGSVEDQLSGNSHTDIDASQLVTFTLRHATRTYLINALGSPKSLKNRPFRQGQTIYEMASSHPCTARLSCLRWTASIACL